MNSAVKECRSGGVAREEGTETAQDQFQGRVDVRLGFADEGSSEDVILRKPSQTSRK